MKKINFIRPLEIRKVSVALVSLFYKEYTQSSINSDKTLKWTSKINSKNIFN